MRHKDTYTHIIEIWSFTQGPPGMDSLPRSYGNWISSWLKPNKFDTKIIIDNMAASNIRPILN